ERSAKPIQRVWRAVSLTVQVVPPPTQRRLWRRSTHAPHRGRRSFGVRRSSSSRSSSDTGNELQTGTAELLDVAGQRLQSKKSATRGPLAHLSELPMACRA